LPVAEVAGYLGGALVIVAVGLIVAPAWDGVSLATRLLLLFGASVLALVAGVRAPAGRTAWAARLRSVSWVLSSAAFVGALAVLGSSGLDLSDRNAALFAAGGGVAHTACTYAYHRSALQQICLLAALAATAGLASAHLAGDALPSVAICTVGLCWALLGLGGYLRPSDVAMPIGAAVATVAAATTEAWTAGIVLAVSVVGLLWVAAVLLRDLTLVVVGALGTVIVLPRMLGRWFTGTGAAFVLLCLGLGVVGMAAHLARRDVADRRPALVVPGRFALLGAGLLAVVATVGILVGGQR
jgi:hypothetical protein